MRLFAEKWEEVGAVTRKYDAAREKGVDKFKKSDLYGGYSKYIKS